jgi:hypothetical protein
MSLQWIAHKSLSVVDMDRLRGTHLMEQLVCNRLTIAAAKDALDWQFLRMHECAGAYYIINNKHKTEILFECVADLDTIQQRLVQYKLKN